LEWQGHNKLIKKIKPLFIRGFFVMENKTNAQETNDFRNKLGIIKKDGSRSWVFAKKPQGKYYNYRTFLSWFLLAFLLFAPTPLMNINGNQFLMFNFFTREFFIFSVPFFPQDFYLFAIGMVVSIIFIVLFTVVYGRVFCGWICPQTIFLEMVFRKIEFAIDGDRGAQMRLSKQKWNEEKIKKRVLKWSIFAVLSFIIANVFLAYLVGWNELVKYMIDGPIEHLTMFFGVLFFTGAFYFVFTWFREQACTLVCPYGRLQGALTDDNTIQVAYDYKRGEGLNGRAKFRKNENRKEKDIGDCIDCNQCVVVCPTGIDIRNGNQLECVGCTACMDACDNVMSKVGHQKGLIRYASEHELRTGKKWKLTPKVVAISSLLFGLLLILSSFLFFRSSVDSKFLKIPGSTYAMEEGQIITNVYQYSLVNKTNSELDLNFKLVSHKGEITVEGARNKLILKKGKQLRGIIKIRIPSAEVQDMKEEITVGVYNQKGKKIDSYTTIFMGPFKL
jgi:cytochrome c oxidase accessory protein FixG